MSRLVFLDLDGTVVNADQQVPRSAREAIGAAVAAGHEVFMCTGRTPVEIYPWLWEVGFSGAVTGNGAVAVLRGDVIVDERIEAAELTQVERYLRSCDAAWMWQNPEGMFSPMDYLRVFGPGLPPGNCVPGDWSDYVDLVSDRYFTCGVDRAAKGMVTFFDPAVTLERVRAEIGHLVTVFNGSVGPREGLTVELSKLGVNKGFGLCRVAEALGRELADTVAVGDSSNDLEMMQVAGLSVAMGNGIGRVKELAHWTAPHIDEDGLAQALRWVFSHR